MTDSTKPASPPLLAPWTDPTDDIVASLAVTLDGYVCRPDGGVEYLDKYPIEGFDFDAWVSGIGAIVMGSASYVQAVGFGWIWGDRPTLVLTSRTDLPVPDGAPVEFHNGDTGPAILDFAARTPKRLWVFGGGRVVTDALLAGVVDTLDITVMPEAIGEGIPLFVEPYDGPMRMAHCVPYPEGPVRLVYDTRPG